MDDFGAPSTNSRLQQFLQDILSCETPSYSSFQSVSDSLKAHPEDIESTFSFIFSSLNSPAKDWRRINNSLALCLTLLKSTNPQLSQHLKHKSELFKQLMEFFYIESRADKGGVVRDKARLIFFILNTPGMLESEHQSPKKNTNSPWHQEDPRSRNDFSLRKSDPVYRNTEPPYRNTEQVFRNTEQVFRNTEQVFRNPEPAYRNTEYRNTDPSYKNTQQVPYRNTEEPKKNMFQGINVKTPANLQSTKKVIEQDLLGDFEPAANVKDEKKNSSGFELLSLNDEPVKISAPAKNDWMDIPIIQNTEKINVEPVKSEIKVNIGDFGGSMNYLKVSGSSVKTSQPQPPPPPKDLESKLLNFDDLELTPSQEKPKPNRSYY